jgi:L-cysteate sulfo-lyase
VSRTADCIGIEGGVDRTAVVADGDYVGPGYGLPTPGMIEAVEMLARHEGILLDPVYTGKGMAGLIGLIRKGRFRKGQNVIFVHTGGAAGLFGYRALFAGTNRP